MSRTAIVLAGVVLALLVPSMAAGARSEFFGIVQIATLDNQDIQGMADARVRTNRFILKWGWVQPNQGSFRWGPADRFIGRLAISGIRTFPAVWGNPDWLPGSGSTPPIGGPAAENAWRNLLRALVARYGPGGAYWTTAFRQRYGADATPQPIQYWQIWNEPNLKKYFAPNVSPGKYGRLVQISDDAIQRQNPQARVVLAGMSGNGDMSAWNFLTSLYNVSGIKNRFDAVALHPYSPTLAHQRTVIEKVRTVMKNRGDAATPLWLTELAWGSAEPDGFGLNKGPAGQAQMLTGSYNMILRYRKLWNVQRLFWYHWRDPDDVAASCSFCASAALLNFNRTPKPAYFRFRSFTAETTRPQATITGGPGSTRDTTPTFTFTSNEPGSTFICRVDASAYKPCSSPYTTPPLANGNHALFVKAIDAPGNESARVWRGFNVDTQPPARPRITDSDPHSPANNNVPKLKGTAEAGSKVRLFKTAGCTGAPVAQGWAGVFASPGITASVANNTTTAFRARAVDAAGNVSLCSAPFTYEESTP